MDRPLRRNRPVNDGNCNVNAESVPVPCLDARADAHAAPRRTAAPGSAPGTAPAAALDLDPRGLDVALLVSVVKFNVVGTITPLALDRSGIVFARVLEFGFAFVPFAGLLRAPAAVALAVRVHALDQILGHAGFPLAVVISNVVGAVAAIPIDLSSVPFRSPTISGLDFGALAEATALRAPGSAPRPAPRPRSRPTPAAQGLDPLQFYALLRIPVVEEDVVRIIGLVDARDLALIPLAAALEIRFDLIAFAGLLRRGAPIVLGVRVQRLDKLLLDPRLVLAIVVGDVEPVWKSTSELGDVASMARGAGNLISTHSVERPVASVHANLAGVELRAAA